MLRFLLTLLLAVFVGHSLFAEERPPVLDCTGPTGADAKTVVAAQRAWAKYLGEAGTRTRYYNGDADEGVFEIAQCTENNFTSTAKVGSKLPNAFGLYDMAGNVTEWCADRWRRDFAETQTTDPRGPKTGTIYVHRGNAWDSYGRTCNATSSGLASETYGGSQLGFRLARVASKDE